MIRVVIPPREAGGKPKIVRRIWNPRRRTFTYKGKEYIIDPRHVYRTRRGWVHPLNPNDGKTIVRPKPGAAAYLRGAVIGLVVFFGAMWVNEPLAIVTGLLCALAGASLGVQYGRDWMKAHGVNPDDPREKLQDRETAEKPNGSGGDA